MPNDTPHQLASASSRRKGSCQWRLYNTENDYRQVDRYSVDWEWDTLIDMLVRICLSSINERCVCEAALTHHGQLE